MISILMPIYNGIEFINESVNSILNQTFKNWELLIGVNGYDKNSEVYIKAKSYENEKIKVFDFYHIKGKSTTLNKLIKYCKFDWICLLDVDDLWLPLKLQKQFEIIEKNQNIDIIGTRCKYIGNSNTIPKLPVNSLDNFNFFTYNPIINSSCLLKKELANWSDEFNGVEDYELWIKLWLQGKKFFNISELLVLHRIHPESAFNSKGNHLKVKNMLKKYKS
jgi:glycosyltransferase involved in cell wall biosynthesis